MAIKTYLDSHQVFNAHDFALAFPNSQTDRNLLSRAVRAGKVERERRGLYVSRCGRFAGARANSLDVALGAADDAVFGYLTAFQLHGVAHNVATLTQFYTKRRIASFQCDGQSYAPYYIGERQLDTISVLTAMGLAYRVTTREQTLIDCLARPSLAGGPENVLRALAGLSYIDGDKVGVLAQGIGHSGRARLGWVLEARREQWHVGDELLDVLVKSLGAGPFYFSSSAASEKAGWVSRWRLYLPFPEQEMLAWLNP